MKTAPQISKAQSVILLHPNPERFSLEFEPKYGQPVFSAQEVIFAASVMQATWLRVQFPV
jgi:hypothetical protein